jgi:hypothetical protein
MTKTSDAAMALLQTLRNQLGFKRLFSGQVLQATAHKRQRRRQGPKADT